MLAAWNEDDLGDEAAPARVLAAAEQSVGPLTALVIVHTESRLGGVLDTTAEAFDRHMAVNARATLLLAAEFARRFRGEHGSGRIVAFTSGALHGEVAYGASKAALERVVVAAAAELAPQGITVNAVDPGPTDTGWMSPDELLKTRRMSLVAVCCSSASASRFSASTRRFSRSRTLAPSSFGVLSASGRLASAFTFAAFARLTIRFSLPPTAQ